jgi:hypothetical protein
MFTKPVKKMGSNGEETTESVPIPFADNYELDLDDGNRIHQFLQPIDSSNFSDWLSSRKRKWRSKWNVYEVEAASEEDDERYERSDCSVRVDFWRDRYLTFDQWLNASLGIWKKGYSWNSRKRQKILQVCEEIVHFPSSDNPKIAKTQFRKWLRIRKGQWRVLRRKRQRLSAEESEFVSPNGDNSQTTDNNNDSNSNNIKGAVGSTMANTTHHGLPSSEILCIDALLEEEELLQRSKRERQPLDISFLFFPSSGCPDDIAANILEYLDRMEYAKLLCVSKSTSEGLKSRNLMWQQLCPSRWTLPRRPRKPWHELYLSKLRMEVNLSRKQWDDLLSKISDILLKGDQLSVVKKLVLDAEKKFSFDVNYISGVVCERNSILNLAVIHQRHKVRFTRRATTYCSTIEPQRRRKLTMQPFFSFLF